MCYEEHSKEFRTGASNSKATLFIKLFGKTFSRKSFCFAALYKKREPFFQLLSVMKEVELNRSINKKIPRREPCGGFVHPKVFKACDSSIHFFTARLRIETFTLFTFMAVIYSIFSLIFAWNCLVTAKSLTP